MEWWNSNSRYLSQITQAGSVNPQKAEDDPGSEENHTQVNSVWTASDIKSTSWSKL